MPLLCYFRGVLRGLIPGLLIAIASGVGVALSVLGGNAGSLVGVAISASLLPPAVNAVSSYLGLFFFGNFPLLQSECFRFITPYSVKQWFKCSHAH